MFAILSYTEMSTIADKIRIDAHSAKPIYQQIAEQVQQLIVTRQLRAGEHLPSVRHLGHLFNISPNTVAKAYLELERKQVVVSKRGGGTIVTSGMDDAFMRGVRQKHLSDNVNDDIIRILSQGYTPEELEAVFYTNLERWREERRLMEVQTSSPLKNKSSKIIRIVGSHDIALNILIAMFRQREIETVVELTQAGSLGGLIALQEEKADLAGTHLLDEETGEYNLPFIKRILPGRDIAVINLAYRVQGLMVSAGNPKKIKGLSDLRRPDVVFINRQKSSGTRVLLDMHLKKQKISPGEITGYDIELDNHLAVASAVAQGKADTGLGIEAAARSTGLDFLPLFNERYDLIIPVPVYKSKLVAPLLKIIGSNEFKKIIKEVDGYDTSQTGKTTFLP